MAKDLETTVSVVGWIDERSELTLPQQALNVALSLMEAARELTEAAQHPDRLRRDIDDLQAMPTGIHPFGDALDAIAQAIVDIHFLSAARDGVLADQHPTEDLAEASARWLHGD